VVGIQTECGIYLQIVYKTTLNINTRISRNEYVSMFCNALF
jgi:hypothetical protein